MQPILSLQFLHFTFKKKLSVFIIGFLFNCCFVVSAQDSIHFQKKSWAEVLELAQKENKPIFVDAFTSWCGPCKKMAKDVFSDSTVALFFNAEYINYSIDIETPDGKLFDSLFGVSAYPSLLFFESSGKIISREVGFKGVSKLITLGVRANNYREFEYSTEKMRAGYENGTSNKHDLYKYLIVLRDSGRAVDSVAAAIIRKLEPADLKNDTAYSIWADYDQRLNSDLLDYFLDHKQWFISKSSKDGFDHKLNTIVSENLVRARMKNDLVALEKLKDFIRRVYEGEEEQNVLDGVDRKFNAPK